MPPTAPSASDTVFDRVSALARETGAINLGQGFPEIEHAPELLAAAQRALVEHSNQYPPMRGLPELRAAVARYYVQEQGLAVDPAQVIVTSGATEALAAAILAFVGPGDEAVLLQPFYDAYLPLVRRAGGTARIVPLEAPGWTIPFDALEAAIGPRTRAILVNTPNNPTGTLVSRADLERLGALCEASDIVLICDEVWEGMILDGSTQVSPLHVESLKDRSVKIGSAGKIFSLTGWKVGWAVAAPALAERIAAQHQFLTFTTAVPLQWAVAEGLALPAEWHSEHRARYVAAYHRLAGGLALGGYAVLPSAATWFLTIDLTASDLESDDEAVATRMIREAGVAAIPVSAFCGDEPEKGYLRFCFAKEDATLDTAIERLARFRERS
ncbi:aminotransferase class I/II-fold pyridoxal phosphate-dependent enzyme [Altererythrobacter salegens]|uniref:Aminotransferase class I/II-fold pyridoxal phosphate-dependent enzyme n=1 Tax=Croceibacterium salegens TaxID=1737568 RepID=A0A6I4STE9_9SPHN|nr:aminotransferase class I/II-fold pyridoxal phosphate-dependent enzyme [Croceibacterium salegens]MXO58176.1 aminotransferase class I/II-fold pyridoxal phosphate-dependent enzyme [Croceibacterium salegens]